MFSKTLKVVAIAVVALVSSIAPAAAGSGFELRGMRSMSATCTSAEFGTWRVEARIVYDDYREPNLPAIDTSGRLSDVQGYSVIEGWAVAPVGEIWRFGYNPRALVPPSLLVYISPPMLLGLVNTEPINAVLSGPYGQSEIDAWWVDSDRDGACAYEGSSTPNLDQWTRRR